METYNLLYNIRHKFESNQRIQGQVDIQLRHQFTQDKYQSIVELCQVLGDITSVLLFDLKALDIKDQQIGDLQAEYDSFRTQTVSQIQQIEDHRRSELQGLQENFEKKYERFKDYQIDIEKINKELTE